MEIAKAAELANTFLTAHAAANHCWTPPDVQAAMDDDPDDDGLCTVFFGRAQVDPRDPGLVWIRFACGLTPDDRANTCDRPEQKQRADENLAALRSAHPELAGVRGTFGPEWILTL